MASRIRNRVNFAAGIFVPVFISGFALLVMDPLAAFRGPETGTGFNSFGLSATGLMAIGSMLSYVALGRPFLEVGHQHLRVRNPFVDWKIPVGAVLAIDGSRRYLTIKLKDGRKVSVRACESSLRMQISVPDHWLEKVQGLIPETSVAEDSSPLRSWKILDYPVLGVSLFWVIYFLCGLVRHFVFPWL